MAYSDLIRETYPQFIGLVDRSDGGNDNDVKFKGLKQDIRAALDGIQANMEAGNIGDGSVTTVKLGAAAVTSAKIADGAVSAGKVATGGISAAGQFAAGVVDTAALADTAVTTAKLGSNAVTTAKITDANVTSAKLADGAVAAGKIAAGGLSATNQIANGIITMAKTAQFISTEQTGTGAVQNIAHGLTVAPTAVLVHVTDDTAAYSTGYSIVEGSHTTTNVVLTVTDEVKYKVQAWV